MYTKQEIEKLVNQKAHTDVVMLGEINNDGIYEGHIQGSSTDQLYDFLSFIARTRGEAFEEVGIRLHKKNPPSFMCYITFDTNDLKPKKGLFKRLFG